MSGGELVGARKRAKGKGKEKKKARERKKGKDGPNQAETCSGVTLVAPWTTRFWNSEHATQSRHFFSLGTVDGLPSFPAPPTG